MSPESTVADIHRRPLSRPVFDRAAATSITGKVGGGRGASWKQSVQAARATPYEIEFITRIRSGNDAGGHVSGFKSTGRGALVSGSKKLLLPKEFRKSCTRPARPIRSGKR